MEPDIAKGIGRAGQIAFLKLHDFMCHQNFEWDLGYCCRHRSRVLSLDAIVCLYLDEWRFYLAKSGVTDILKVNRMISGWSRAEIAIDGRESVQHLRLRQVRCIVVFCMADRTASCCLLWRSPNVNFISGTNGSGKSALLNAIQLCLGARATDTGRNAKISDFIRTVGESDDRPPTSAVANITIWYLSGRIAMMPETPVTLLTAKRDIPILRS